MLNNKLTLIVDGNWLLLSRVAVLKDKFDINNSDNAKQSAGIEMKNTLIHSILKTIKYFDGIDNIIIVADGGSFRKSVEMTDRMKVTDRFSAEYKGNRKKESTTDWNYIFKCYNDFLSEISSIATVSRHYHVEGDDEVWYWSRYLNDNNINAIIWTSDCDLKQLIAARNGVFTAWYNDRAGLWLHSDCNISNDIVECFMHPQFDNPVLSRLKNQVIYNTHYIDPESIVVKKVLEGDAGDNIPPVVWQLKKSKSGQERLCKFTSNDREDICQSLNISSIKDIQTKKEQISSYILNSKKFRDYDITKEDIISQLDYNLKVVWLTTENVPENLLEDMKKDEYKQSNMCFEYYKQPTTNEAEALFEDIMKFL